MTGVQATSFLGKESYQEALLEYARTLEEPLPFVDWWPMARELYGHYDDVPERLWPRDKGLFQELRVSTFSKRFGEGWRGRLKELEKGRAATGSRGVEVPGEAGARSAGASREPAVMDAQVAGGLPAMTGEERSGGATEVEQAEREGVQQAAAVSGAGASREPAVSDAQSVAPPVGLPAAGGGALVAELVREEEEEELAQAQGRSVQLPPSLEYDPLVVEALGPLAEEARQSYEVGLSETTSEAAVDINDQCAAMDEVGVSNGAILVNVGMQGWLRRIHREFRASGTALTFPAWAADQLNKGVPFSTSPEEAVSHYLALARVAGVDSQQQIRESAEVRTYVQDMAALGADVATESGGFTATRSATATPPRDGSRHSPAQVLETPPKAERPRTQPDLGSRARASAGELFEGPGAGASREPAVSAPVDSPAKTAATLDAHDLVSLMQENTRAMLEGQRLLAKEEREALLDSRRETGLSGTGVRRGGSGITGLEFKQNLPILRTPIPILIGIIGIFKA